MKKIVFTLVGFVVMLASCSPRNYFLVNSDSAVEYDKNSGTVRLVWKWFMHKYGKDTTETKVDSITLPVKVVGDSLTTSRVLID